MTLLGQMFKRREPAGDPGDFVVLQGTTTEHVGVEQTRTALIVACTEFGAIPEAWSESTVLYSAGDFAEEFALMSDVERAALALESAANARAATDALGVRDSPWSRS